MRYRNQSRFKAFIASPFTLVAAVAIVALLGRASWNIHKKVAASDARLSGARAELARLEGSRSDLAGEIEALSTPEGMRAEIREKYHAVEPGESVALIVDSSSQPAATSEAEAVPEPGWFGKLLRMIRGGMRD